MRRRRVHDHDRRALGTPLHQIERGLERLKIVNEGVALVVR
jgi:hypothetical protein